MSTKCFGYSLFVLFFMHASVHLVRLSFLGGAKLGIGQLD